MKKIVKECYHILTLRILFPLVYRIFSLQKVRRQKVVFIEANLKQLSNSLKILYDRLSEEGDKEIKVHCLQEIYVSKVTYIINVLKCLCDMATAGTIVLCEGSRIVSCIPKRKETCIIQVWHGCGAFKKFGFSTSELKFGGDRKENERYSYYKNYDIVTVSSSEVVWAYEEAMNLKNQPGIVQPLGISRTDVFFDQAYLEAAKDRVHKAVPAIKDKKIIFYAPTFRGSVGGAKAPDRLDITAMKEELGDQYVLLIKQHPVVKHRPEIPEEAKDFAYDVSELLSIEELICAGDICISDYSSLIFEFGLFDKPMLFFSYDLEEYGDWRGFYYSYEDMTPGPVVQTTTEIIDYITNIQESFDVQKVRAFRDKYMKACDGHSTDRLILLIEKGKM